MRRTEVRPAEVFPPGEFISEELEARDWTVADLARVMGRSTQMVRRILRAQKAITAQLAVELGDAFGTSPELWLNLEATWSLSRVRRRPEIARRAHALSVA